MAASNRLKAGSVIYDYFPEVARANMSKAEARAEYARLRKIANRRLDALARNFPQSEIVRRYKGGFSALPRQEKGARVYKKLYEVARYLNTQLGSVSGQREARNKAIETLHEHGYTFITKKNFDEFGRFMKEVKTHALYRAYSSERYYDLFETAKKSKADPQKVARSFEKYITEDGPMQIKKK